MSESLYEINKRSEEVEETLTKVPNWMIRYGSILFFLLIITILVLSWFIKYPDTIASSAIITTKIPPQKEYAKSSGKLVAVLARNSDFVEINQPLAVIENLANYKDVYLLKTILDSIKVTNAKTFTFPFYETQNLSLGEINSEFAIFENNYVQYQLNKELHPFSNDLIDSKISASEAKIRLGQLNDQKNINGLELDLKEKELMRIESLFQKGVISQQEFESKQLEYLQYKRDFKNISLNISSTIEAISSAKKRTKNIDIEIVTKEMVLLKNVFQSYNQLKNSLKDWESKYVLKSNIKGKIAFLNYWAVNQTVNEGDLVFTIIPTENSNFIAKLIAPAQNSGKIKVGQDVKIRLDNYSDAEFGTLSGKVENISQMPNKQGFYVIDVSLPSKLITSYGIEIEFTQEMRGVAEIITEDLRLIERFFYQLKEILRK